MRRLRLTVAYDGTPYHGLQAQEGLPTVQGEITAAVAKHLGSPPAGWAACGRTDAGVHAHAMVVHVDHESPMPLGKIKSGLNWHLPDTVRITQVAHMEGDFHARFSATRRAYEYLVYHRPVASPLWAGRAHWVKYPMDVEAMRRCAALLPGERDFSAFRTSACQAKSPVVRLTKFNIRRHGSLLRFQVEGVTFLHNMVRIMVGTLIDVGRGKIPEHALPDIITRGDRVQAGITLPPHGLYFARATYPDHLQPIEVY